MFTPLDDVAHVIQTALTPAFLLAALASLLGVFASRLDGVANRVDHLARQIARLRTLSRSVTVDHGGCTHHVRLDHDASLEVAVLRRDTVNVREFAKTIIAGRGVTQR